MYLSACKMVHHLERHDGYFIMPSQLRSALEEHVMRPLQASLQPQNLMMMWSRRARVWEYLRWLGLGVQLLTTRSAASHQLFMYYTYSISLSGLYLGPLLLLLSMQHAAWVVWCGGARLLPAAMRAYQVMLDCSLIFGPVSLLNSWYSLRAGNGPSAMLLLLMHSPESSPGIPFVFVVSKVGGACKLSHIACPHQLVVAPGRAEALTPPAWPACMQLAFDGAWPSGSWRAVRPRLLLDLACHAVLCLCAPAEVALIARHDPAALPPGRSTWSMEHVLHAALHLCGLHAHERRAAPGACAAS